MSFLVGRIGVKELANIPKADTRWDSVLDQMRELASRQVEEITGRQFAKVARTELHPSYTQYWGDPSPQYVIVNAPPIDTALTVTLLWAPFDDHDTNGTPLVTPDDWKFEADAQGETYALRVQRFTTLPQNLPLPAGAIGVLGDSPVGFQVTYTGGYVLSATGGTDPVDIGEEDVAAIPAGLASLVTQKLADDFKFLRAQRRLEVSDPEKMLQLGQQAGGFGVVVSTGIVRPWTEAQLAYLKMYARKDMNWIGPYFTTAAGRPLAQGG